jgi:hypothetical protein
MADMPAEVSGMETVKMEEGTEDTDSEQTTSR